MGEVLRIAQAALDLSEVGSEKPKEAITVTRDDGLTHRRIKSKRGTARATTASRQQP